MDTACAFSFELNTQQRQNIQLLSLTNPTVPILINARSAAMGNRSSAPVNAQAENGEGVFLADDLQGKSKLSPRVRLIPNTP